MNFVRNAYPRVSRSGPNSPAQPSRRRASRQDLPRANSARSLSPLPAQPDQMETKPKKGLRSLLGVLAFLGRYPGRVAGCLCLLLVNITIEMTLPQIIGNAITNLRWHMEWGAEFARNNYVLLFLS